MRQLTVRSADGADVVIPGGVFDDFARRIGGQVILEDDPGYEEARRVWNAMIDRRPAAIVRCATASDAVACVKLARRYQLKVTVRGGGHNVAGNAVNDGGLVIDLSRMNAVDVDPDRRTARVQGGATLGDVDRATQPHGLSTPLGVVPRTGVAGLALHGGLGWLLRRHGTTADNIVSAEAVTADGSLRVASEEDNPDLLWALRGGGGNFGVVTSFELRLHPVGPEVWACLAAYRLEDLEKVLGGLNEYNAAAPDDVTVIVQLWSMPNYPKVPEEVKGRPSILVEACLAGALEDGEKVIAPLRELATPLADLSGPMSFLNMQDLSGTFGLAGPSEARHYWKSSFVRELGPELAPVLRSAVLDRPSDLSSISIYSLGGAFARFGPEHAAFDNRDQGFMVAIEADWVEPREDDANIAWARDTYRRVQAGAPPRVYLNFPGFAEEERMVERSFGENFQRLAEVKARYDPTNLFRGHLPIRPLAKATAR